MQLLTRKGRGVRNCSQYFNLFLFWRIRLLVCIYQGGKVYESGIGCIPSRELVPSHLVDLSTNNSSSIFAFWIRILWISKNIIMKIELGPSRLVDLLNNNSSSIFALWIRILWISIAWKRLLKQKRQKHHQLNFISMSRLIWLFLDQEHPSVPCLRFR